jgi:hypothetical protein
VQSRIQTGATEPIEVLVVDAFGDPLTGLTNIKVKIRRLSDGYFFDWSDNNFKSNPTTLLQALTEIHAANFPGEYRLDTVDHVKGFDTSEIVNKAADDTYRVTVLQDPKVAAVPHLWIGEIKEGDWVDFFDQAISDNATPAEVKAELVAMGLDHLVSVNPGIVPPAAGTYIRQILDKLTAAQTHFLEMSFSYDPIADSFTGNAWLESGNMVVVASGAIVLDIYDQDRTLMFSMSDAAPDAGGVFKVTKAAPTGLVKNRSYYAEATVTLPAAAGTVKGIKGMFTVG